MTRDEHRDIIAFIDGAVRQDGAAGSVPLDVEADAIIRALFVRNPEAPYRVTRLAMAQAEALKKIQAELAEAKLAEAKLAEAKAASRKHWLLRLLSKPKPRQRMDRLDPSLSLFSQDLQGP